MNLLALQVTSAVGWTVLAVLLFYGGVRLYDLIDPIDYRAEVRRGNIAAGIVIAAIITALAAIVIAVIIT